MSDSDHYSIGYQKPPKHTRFKKGVSGNPSGRRKRVQTVSSLLDQELKSQITITEKGEKVRITKFNAIVKRAVHDALQGNFNNLNKLLHLDAQLLKDLDDPQPVKVVVNVENMRRKLNEDNMK